MPAAREDLNDTTDLEAQYAAGVTICDLAKRYRCSKSLISNRLKAAGVDLRGRGPTSGLPPAEALLLLRLDGLTDREIGERYGTTKHAVQARFRRYREASAKDFAPPQPQPARPPESNTPLGDWQASGTCTGVDPELFFAPDHEQPPGKAKREQAAKAVCAHCPVIQECRQWALDNRTEYGIFGGLTELERRTILRKAAA